MKDRTQHCIIIGAMKCGTTSLFHSLSQHCPAIAPSQVKDTKFFVDRERGGNWEKGFNWYLTMFPQGNYKIKLEASTHYSKYPDFPDIPRRISQQFDRVKLIYLVRDPLARSFSHFFHNLTVDGEKLDIQKSLTHFPNKYINYSDYALQLSQYYHYFDPKDILILNLVEEEYRHLSLEKLKDFLGRENFSDRFSLEQINTLQENFAKTENKLDIPANMIKRSDNKIQMALKLGLDQNELRKIVQICRENILKFKPFYPFSIDPWLTKYQDYL